MIQIVLRIWMLPALVASLAFVPACSDDDDSQGATDTDSDSDSDTDSDADSDTDSDSDSDTDADTDTDTDTDSDSDSDSDSITVADQALYFLSTTVTILNYQISQDGWIVVYEDAGGSPGNVLGMTHIQSGTATDTQVVLDRPGVDGETLHAVLHADSGASGVWEPAVDLPLENIDEEPIAGELTIIVPPHTPALRFNVSASGMSAFVIDSVEPAEFSSVVGSGSGNQSLTLEPDWRYEIVNAAASGHPFELLQMGASSSSDTVLLSQSASGSMESDADILWTDDGIQTIAFTVSSALASSLTGYRCAIHVSTMRGTITVN